MPGNRCPARFFCGFEVKAREVDAPFLYAFLVANGFKGDCCLKNPTVLVIFDFRNPLVIPAQVYGSAVGHLPIPLGTCCIGTKGEPIGEVIKGIHKEQEVVVFPETEIPPERLDHVGSIACMVVDHDEIELLIIVTHPHICFHLGETGIHRSDHKKVACYLRFLPRFFIHDPIHSDGATRFLNV